jgi:hypothetical protein
LLYDTHCKACHTTRLHWRDRRQATDWESLKQWVDRWQRQLRLEWSDADVAEVARYLNERYYHHPQGSDRSAAAGTGSTPCPRHPARPGLFQRRCRRNMPGSMCRPCRAVRAAA